MYQNVPHQAVVAGYPTGWRLLLSGGDSKQGPKALGKTSELPAQKVGFHNLRCDKSTVMCKHDNWHLRQVHIQMPGRHLEHEGAHPLLQQLYKSHRGMV